MEVGADLIEKGLSDVADAIGEKIDGKWWAKILYPFLVVGVLAIPIIYYFW